MKPGKICEGLRNMRLPLALELQTGQFGKQGWYFWELSLRSSCVLKILVGDELYQANVVRPFLGNDVNAMKCF